MLIQCKKLPRNGNRFSRPFKFTASFAFILLASCILFGLGEVKVLKIVNILETQLGLAQGGWWGGGSWQYRRSLTLTSAPVNYAVYLRYTDADAQAIYSKSRTDAQDIRIVYQGAEIDRDVMTYSDSLIEIGFKTQAAISGSNSTSYKLYYANPFGTSPKANKDVIWQYWDDFSGDLSKWQVKRGDWSIDSGILKQTNTVHEEACYYLGAHLVNSNSQTWQNVGVMARMRTVGAVSPEMHVLGRYQSQDLTYLGGFGWREPPDKSDHEIYIYDPPEGEFGFVRLVEDDLQPPDNVWRTYELRLSGSTLKIWRDDDVRNTAINSRISSAGKVGLRTCGEGKEEVDWIRARGYNGTDTKVTSGPEEKYNLPPAQPSNLTQSPGAEGAWTNDSTPYFDFSVTDPNAGDIVGYQIQIDNNSNFASPIIDFEYINNDTVPPAVNFTYQVPNVCPGSGYIMCDAVNVPLPDGSYYWRVRAKDGDGEYSAWADNNQGFQSAGIDFNVDISAPSVTNLSVNSITLSEHPLITNDTTPTIAWTSQDNGASGLYQVEVWRTDDLAGSPNPANWQMQHSQTTNVDNGSWSQSVSLGTYWYGIHILDNTSVPNGDNCITEAGEHCGGVASDAYDPRTLYGPIKVSVIDGESPIANFTFCVLSNNYVYFTDLSSDSDGTIQSWDWDFGDGQSSSAQHPIHQYAASSIYGVTLEVTDNDGLTDRLSQSVDLATAELCSYLFLASASIDCDTLGLTWENAVGANSYEIYRAVNGGGYELLTSKNKAAVCTDLGCSYDDNTVSMGNVYSYYLKAVTSYHTYYNSTSSPNPVCTGDEENICPLADISPLCAPGSLSVVSTPCGAIVLSWPAVPEVVGYEIERSLINQPELFEQIGGGTLTETAYSDQQIIPGITYYYQVRSVYEGPEYSDYVGPVSAMSYCYRGLNYSED